jgi:hypothetical protein
MSFWKDITTGMWDMATGGAYSAKKANEANINYQKEVNAQSIDLANSAHTRQVADLKNAGLNPILSNGGTGAITPGLTAPHDSGASIGKGVGEMGEKAISAYAGIAGAQQAQSAAELSSASAEKTKVDTALAPALAKAEIASKTAGAGSAKAQATYSEAMEEAQRMANKNNTAGDMDKDAGQWERIFGTVKRKSEKAGMTTAKNIAKLFQ